MNFLNYILANHWAIDGRVGRAALAFLERRAGGARTAPEEVRRIVAERDHARAEAGDGEDWRPLTAQEIARPWDGELFYADGADRRRGYRVEGGVAVVPVEGVLSRYASIINDQSQPRGTGSMAVGQSVRAAMADPQVAAVVLSIDSPGGTVAGTEELAVEIARAGKPVVAYAAYLCCSGAYWLASQADLIVAARTAAVGNIGVYQVVEDSSRAADEMGLTVHIVKAGKYKAIGVPGTAVTREQLDTLQEEVDAIYTEFVRSVARGRAAAGLTESAVVKLADGRSWVGEAAVQLRLADAVGTQEEAIAAARRLAAQPG